MDQEHIDMDLGPLKIDWKDGTEPILNENQPSGFTFYDFWQWLASDLVDNTTRGLFGEFLVGKALNCIKGPYVNWGSCDLETEDGITIAVKTSGRLQSWRQKSLNPIKFDVSRKLFWDSATGEQGDAYTYGRWAKLYVFCVHHHEDKGSVNPADLSQWNFYVLPTYAIDVHFKEADQAQDLHYKECQENPGLKKKKEPSRSFSEKTIVRIKAKRASFSELSYAVKSAL